MQIRRKGVLILNNENISPEIIAEMYISMTPEQKELFWKMLAEELQHYYGNSD